MRRVYVVGGGLAVAVIAAVLLTRHRPAPPPPENHAAVHDPRLRQLAALIDMHALRSAGGIRIAGHVTAGGAPAPHATVELREFDYGIHGVTRVTTNERGAFDFGARPAASYVVFATEPGKIGTRLVVDTRKLTPDLEPDNLELELEACSAFVHGTIRDASGGTIGGAVLTAFVQRTATAAVSAADGGFAFCTRTGDAIVTIGADGYATEHVRLAALPETPHDFELSPEAVIIGRVVAADDGSPVAGATIRVRDRSDAVQATSDDAGRFKIGTLHPREYRLSGTAEQLRTRDEVRAVARVEKPAELTVELTRTVTLHGLLLEGAKPVAKATVTYLGFMNDDTSDDTGHFTLPSLIPGEDAQLSINGYDILTPEHLRLEEDGDVTIQVRAQAHVRGRVIHDGAPVPHATVLIFHTPHENFTEQADDQGRFDLTSLRPGVYRISAESEDVRAIARAQDVTVERGLDTPELVIALDEPEDATITGTVVDAGGTPAEGVFVEWRLSGSNDSGHAITAADGTYSAGFMTGGGDYWPNVRPSQASAQRFQAAPDHPFAAVHLADGRARVAGVRLVIDGGLRSITGRVSYEDGSPAPDLDMTARRRESYQPDARATTNARGEFHLDGLVPQSYVITARSVDGATASLANVAAGSANLVLTMPILGTITGTLIGFSSPPQVVATAQGEPPHAATVSGTTFVISDLPPNTYALTAIAANEGATAQVRLDGSAASVTLTSSGVAQVNGHLTDRRSGLPLAARTCTWQFGENRGGTPVSTDDNGRFVLDVPADQPVRVVCPPTGKDSGASRLAMATAGAPVALELYDLQAGHGGIGFVTIDPGGVTVRYVAPGSPAAEAGLAVGDKILSFDGVSTQGLDQLGTMYLLESSPIGAHVVILVQRGDQQLPLTVVVEEKD